MNPRTKIFVVENDCASLISLMLWVDQNNEFEVLGTKRDTGSLQQDLAKHTADVLLVDIASPALRDIIALRELKNEEGAPSIITMNRSDRAYMDSILASEFDAHVNPGTSLKELNEIIKKVANRRRLTVTATNMPLSKAG